MPFRIYIILQIGGESRDADAAGVKLALTLLMLRACFMMIIASGDEHFSLKDFDC